MDNQQERPRGLEFAAGVAVGEGCFTIGIRRGKGGGFHFAPAFVLSMNDLATVEELVRIFKAHGLPAYVSMRSNRKSMEIRASGYRRTLAYTTALLPYLTGDKKKAAQLVHSFIESRLSRAPKAAPTEEELDLLGELREHLGSRSHKVPLGVLRDYTPNFNKKIKK